MKNYRHLTQEQRYHISHMRQLNFSMREIAEAIGFDKSTISRELKRNSSDRGYGPIYAHESAVRRHVQGASARRFPPAVLEVVSELLLKKFSPAQITGRLWDEVGFKISHESIYRFLYRDKKAGGVLYLNLRGKKKYKKKYGSLECRGTIKNMVSIDERPAIVETRSRIGDWEGDTMTGKHHQGTIVTLAERKARFLVAGTVSSKHADKVSNKVVELLKPHLRKCKTLTKDRGTEFAGHEAITRELNAKVYFAHPASPWERGTNENTNGLLRQYFPKKMDLRKVTEEELQKAVNELNHRPRKCLGFKTPYEVFYGKTVRYVASTAAVALQM